MSKGETPEQIAERIAKDFADFPSEWGRKLSSAILSALRKQIEHCAEIAETSHPQPCICQTCLIRAEAGAAIRKLLRKGR